MRHCFRRNGYWWSCYKKAQLIHKDIQSVLINGAGPIGLGLLAMSKLTLQDLPVLINDVKSSRLLAEKMGITYRLIETIFRRGHGTTRN